jgi:Cu/Ag efflux protein CusF
MKRLLAIPFAALLITASAQAQAPAAKAPAPAAKPPAPAAKAPVEMTPTGTPGKAAATRSAQATATIKAIDVAGRSITLQNKAGETETFKVGPQVQRLAEFAVGDVIVIDYEQGLALEFQPAGSETVAPTAVAAGGRAGPDQAPGAAAAAGVQATVNVTAIDAARRLVTFQGPGGNAYQVKAGPKVQIEKLKVGDRLLATYVESVAIKLEKPKKK